MPNHNKPGNSVRHQVRGQAINIYTVQDLEQRVAARVATILYTVNIRGEEVYLTCSNSDTDIRAIQAQLARFRTIEDGQCVGDFAHGIQPSVLRLVTPEQLSQISQGQARRQRGGIFHAQPFPEGQEHSTAFLSEDSRVVISYYNVRGTATDWTMDVLWAPVEALALRAAAPAPIKRQPAVDSTEAVALEEAVSA